ncbi:cob(I)yrinic acid a,c-diamide adenosyltransferase [Halorhodospira neutriphila]|uniref:Corrinoid adenosyltransferase n=1 Tax=Halorhodospira neutriphila TaxID=168379 RepID=A0ABS1E583_9GAMM|nr:cob(I)yrinic acid a,c-diamide adenosyltransferase [Halorhodospira neutriphila]MBK1726282.1 cob(I)yrinic acid a,c-diamide adenosyltransferase [Halorhodospira neutriphila]
MQSEAKGDRQRPTAGEDRGVLLVLTGAGKGKSSSAFGMVARALGHGRRAGVMRFLEEAGADGAARFLRGQPGVDWRVAGEGAAGEPGDGQDRAEAARQAWAVARAWLSETGPELVVLDELNIALRYEYLALEEVLEDLARRPAWQHVVVTGRYAQQPLMEAADTVSEIKAVRHAHDAGVPAQPGLDR